ncbi:MAG: type I restriction enzyme HsdR N-terminal domain-containing protein [Pseudomonadota bacterium]
MDFSDKIHQLADRVSRQQELCLTEEAAKTAFVLPFLQALGYDVFDPLEVRPEYVADVGTKKGEKVDYAISLNDEIQMLIECKPIGAKLEIEHAGQLFRYFSVTSARFGILTDGVRYCFYTDLDTSNKMDNRPFFVLNLRSYKESDIVDLKRFSKDAFDIQAIVSTASDMKYQRALSEELRREFNSPSDEFTRIIATRVYSGRFTQPIAEKFQGLLKKALSNHIRERVDARLQGALESKLGEQSESEEDLIDTDDDLIETTDTEIDGFKVIRAIASEIIEPERVFIRDRKSYCEVILENNNLKQILRLLFNNETNLRLQIFDQPNSDRISIAKVPDIYQYKSRVLNAVRRHLGAPESTERTNERFEAEESSSPQPMQ